jgi:hypothetical protein
VSRDESSVAPSTALASPLPFAASGAELESLPHAINSETDRMASQRTRP